MHGITFVRFDGKRTKHLWHMHCIDHVPLQKLVAVAVVGLAACQTA